MGELNLKPVLHFNHMTAKCSDSVFKYPSRANDMDTKNTLRFAAIQLKLKAGISYHPTPPTFVIVLTCTQYLKLNMHSSCHQRDIS